MHARTIKKRSRKRMWPRFLAAGAAVLCGAYAALVLTWPIQAVTAVNTVYTPPERTPVAITWPAYGQGAFGTERHGVLSSSTEAETPVPIASITKIVTALTVLDAKPIPAGQAGPIITFTEQDAARYGHYLAMNGSVAPASTGMQLSQYQVMQGMLISSANNYADSLAIWAYGSLEAYLVAAQAYLSSHGLTDTTVSDATGFSPESKSTASDLVRLGSLALSSPVIKDIVSQKSVDLPGAGTLRNTNMLLGSGGIIGTKTGTTDEAGSCLLFAATFPVGTEQLTVTGVLLGAPSHSVLFRDVAAIVDASKTGFQELQLAAKNQRFGTYTAPWGARVDAVAETKVAQAVWHSTQVTQETALKPIKAGDGGQRTIVGTASFKIGDKPTKTNLVLNKDLRGPGWLWRLTHPTEVF